MNGRTLTLMLSGDTNDTRLLRYVSTTLTAHFTIGDYLTTDNEIKLMTKWVKRFDTDETLGFTMSCHMYVSENRFWSASIGKKDNGEYRVLYQITGDEKPYYDAMESDIRKIVNDMVIACLREC